jgi:hypothetical protein
MQSSPVLPVEFEVESGGTSLPQRLHYFYARKQALHSSTVYIIQNDGASVPVTAGGVLVDR